MIIKILLFLIFIKKIFEFNVEYIIHNTKYTLLNDFINL